MKRRKPDAEPVRREVARGSMLRAPCGCVGIYTMGPALRRTRGLSAIRGDKARRPERDDGGKRLRQYVRRHQRRVVVECVVKSGGD